MSFYTICGKPDCVNFAHATHVAQYLFEHLPNFKYKKIEKPTEEWSRFVASINKKNKWYMVNSPIIWKEISTWGGKPYLIGGLGEFWEYIYCYYGLESKIPKTDLQKLAIDNVKFYKEEQQKHSKAGSTFHTVISIFGAGRNPMTELLLENFLQIPEFFKDNGFYVKLYDENFDSAENDQERNDLETIVETYNDLALFGNRKVLKIVDDEDEAVTDTDLLIMIEDFSREADEELEDWTKRCVLRVAMLSDTINLNGKRPLRVIFANEGPACLMATCMVEYCTVIIPANIVVLTADRGLPVINVISQKTGVQVSKIGAPPVWGFVGYNEYIDAANILFKAHIFRPYPRAVNAPKGSTLPLGTVAEEYRLMSYLIPDQHNDITKTVQERRKCIESKIHRKPYLSKLTALHSLLKIWYADDVTDQIISVGVCSDGLHGIPLGMVFSQPCIQDKRRRWRPFPNFPLINDATRLELKKLVDDATEMLQTIFTVQKTDSYISIGSADLDDDTATLPESI